MRDSKRNQKATTIGGLIQKANTVASLLYRTIHHGFALLFSIFARSDLGLVNSVGGVQPTVYVIIPTHKPRKITVQLVRDLIRWNPGITVCVVDDCTPAEYEEKHHIFRSIRRLSSTIEYLRTSTNQLKAGAINYAVRTLVEKGGTLPQVIVTLDDDVVINEHTIATLARLLFADERVGAACTQCRVLNKNKNIITRLQGLEYLGFNAVRIADESFFMGPLVMHGMLTGFRTSALLDVGLFAERHLIEDYEMTSRLKNAGYRVRMSPESLAWTEVPETLGQLWRQRARWINGGISILGVRKYWRVIPQDIIGHGLFLGTVILVSLLVFFGGGSSGEHTVCASLIIVMSLCQAIGFYVFQVWYMRYYAERDSVDWILRLTLIPEFVYANILTLVLMGAYLFHVFEHITKLLPAGNRMIRATIASLRAGFASIGYTKGWGTKG
jgi:poly-beta-1,6-N-acetyl-D-glucosamine synthase